MTRAGSGATRERRKRVRTQPYTYDGLRRLRCAKCGVMQAEAQWNVRSCRAGVNWGYLPLCAAHDAALNDLVLAFFPREPR